MKGGEYDAKETTQTQPLRHFIVISYKSSWISYFDYAITV